MSEETKAKIDIKESWDVNHWCEEFNLRAEELKEIVRMVGPFVADVRMYLGKKLIGSLPFSY